MDTVVDVTETTQIIQVEALTEIHMRVMVRIHFEDHVVICTGVIKPGFYWVARVLGGSGTLVFFPLQ